MIYHVTTKSNWEEALQKGSFEAASLFSEGFIHASKAEQVAGVLDRFYKNQTDLLKLCIDESKLTHPLIYEMAPSLQEEFPHIFGSINLDAIIDVEEIK